MTDQEKVQQVKDQMDYAYDNTLNKADAAADRLRQSSSQTGQQTAGVVEKVTETLKNTSPSELLQDGKEKAQQVATQVSQTASQVASQAGDKVEQATASVGVKMEDAASLIRENAPAGGAIGQVAEKVASGLETGGTYLQVQDLGDIRNDIESLVRRYPMQSLLVGLGVGYLFARAMSR